MKDNNNIEQDKVSLKELIVKVQEYFFEVLKNWWLVILITIPVVAYNFYKVYKLPKNYSADLTFMINEDKSLGGSGGGLSGLAASFGIGGGSGDYSLDKMLALLSSRNIIQQALFEREVINGNEDYFANHFIEEYDFQSQWEEEESTLVGFKFKNKNFAKFSRDENSVLKRIFNMIVGGNSGGLLKSGSNEDTGIMALTFITTREELSIKFLEKLYDKLSKFYIDKTTEKQQRDFDLTKNKVDSLKGALDYAQTRLLKIEDANQKVILKQYRAEETKLRVQIQILAVAYTESIKSQEIADFRLKSSTPFIQPIDTPIPPLNASKSKATYIKSIILGGFLGGFLAIAFIIGRKIIRDTLKD